MNCICEIPRDHPWCPVHYPETINESEPVMGIPTLSHARPLYVMYHGGPKDGEAEYVRADTEFVSCYYYPGEGGVVQGRYTRSEIGAGDHWYWNLDADTTPKP